MRLVALAMCFFVGVAEASVGVVTHGEPTAQGPVEALIKAWLLEHDHQIDDTFTGDTKTSFLNCFVIADLACARGVFENRAGASNIVHVQIDLEPGEGPNYVLTTYWFTRGHDPVVDKRRCVTCDGVALAKAVDESMTALVGGGGIVKGRVKIAAPESDGLIVWIDGVKLGAAPLERDLDPGLHELKFIQRGRVIRSQTIAIEARKLLVIDSPAAERPAVEPRPFPWGVALLAGAGVTAGIAGGVFLYYGSLDGPDERYVYDNATTIGVPTLIVGSVAVIASGVLWFRGRQHSAPSIAVGPDHASVGWAGVF